MAKETGLGWTTFSLDDGGGTLRAIINDITDISFSTPRAVFDVTGLDKSGFERLLGLADFSCDANGVFSDVGATSAHTVCSTASSTSVERDLSMAVSGQTLAVKVFLTDLAYTRGADGALTFSAPMVGTGGAVPTWGT
jgi:hypothetical protein